MIKKLFPVLLAILLSGCTAIHRVEISPLNRDIKSIDETQLDNVFIDNGYGKSSQEYKTIFYPAHRAGQTFVGKWGKSHYHMNKKRGGTEAWIVTEGQNLVVYIVGDSRDVFDRTEILVDDLSVSLPNIYPHTDVSLSKKFFFDVR